MDGLGALGNRMMKGMRMRVPAANRSSPFCFGNERTQDSGHPLSQGPYLSLLIRCISVLSRNCAVGRRPPVLPPPLPRTPSPATCPGEEASSPDLLVSFPEFSISLPYFSFSQSPSLSKKQSNQETVEQKELLGILQNKISK